MRELTGFLDAEIGECDWEGGKLTFLFPDWEELTCCFVGTAFVTEWKKILDRLKAGWLDE